MSSTRFAWEIALRRGAYPPPEPKRGARFASSTACWLCGGETAGVGWPRAAAIPTTFASHNLAAVPHSDAVCQPCAALPLGRWDADDVWARIVSADLPFLSRYDAADDRGRERSEEVWLACESAWRHGQGQRMRRRDPALWNRLVQRWPDMARWG